MSIPITSLIRVTSLAFFALALGACAASTEGSAGAPSDESSMIPPLSASGIHEEANGIPGLKKCVAGPFTSTWGYGNACPNKYTVASSLCELGGFISGSPTSFQCNAIPGSIPQQYYYTISYTCTRPPPCAP